jgi:hypothetical protein
MNVTTRGYTNFRTGANLQESVLTAEVVQKQGIELLRTIPIPNDARGTEGSPTVVYDLVMEDGETHNVIFICTMYNDVEAVDIDTGEVLWTIHVANPIANETAYDSYGIADYWGILSTPVIDTVTSTLYCVSHNSPDGTFKDVIYTLFAIDLATGSTKSKLPLTTASYLPPIAGAAPIMLTALAKKQRVALTFDTRNEVDTVFFGASTFAMDAVGAHGWVIACDVTPLRTGGAAAFAAGWTTTSRFNGSGVWQFADGFAVDAEGYIFVVSGNGAFDGVTDFGESVVKLKYTPAAGSTTPGQGATPASLVPVDWFAPYSDTGRCGLDPTTPWLGSPGNSKSGVSNYDNQTSQTDQDLGIGAVLYIPATQSTLAKNVVITGGKDGLAYVLDADNLGRTVSADFAPAAIAKNYGRLLSPVIGATYYPGDLDLEPTDLQTLPTTPGGFQRHNVGAPVFYRSPRFGNLVYFGGDNAPVRVFVLNEDYSLTYLAAGAEYAQWGCSQSPGGGLGSGMCLSANGAVEDTAVLWVTQSELDANKCISPGRLLAYGADWVDNGTLLTLWNSQDWGIEFTLNKMNKPMVANGRVFVPTYSASVLVFGLA